MLKLIIVDPILLQTFLYICIIPSMRILTTYCLTILLLLTNIGVPVFTHICHGMGRSWTSILIPAEGCCKLAKKDMVRPYGNYPVEASGPVLRKNPCCESLTSFVGIESEFIQSLPTDQEPTGKNIPSILNGKAWIGATSTPLPELRPDSHLDPVLPYGRSLLVFQQVFRI